MLQTSRVDDNGDESDEKNCVKKQSHDAERRKVERRLRKDDFDLVSGTESEHRQLRQSFDSDECVFYRFVSFSRCLNDSTSVIGLQSAVISLVITHSHAVH
jgi:hypothetical protein